jgi:hypothetical protein
MMGIKSDRPIYGLIEKHLKANSQPMTCNALMEIDEVRVAAINEFGGPKQNVQLATNKLSDVLGFMWRRGVVTRYPAPKDGTTFARFCYEWAEKPVSDTKPILPPPSPQTFKKRLNIQEVPNGVEIELDGFVITVRRK